jgi:hypothetical protein
VQQIAPRIADPQSLLGADDEGSMATFLSMPRTVVPLGTSPVDSSRSSR